VTNLVKKRPPLFKQGVDMERWEEGSPEYQLAGFLGCIQVREWRLMEDFMQVSYAQGLDSVPATMQSMFGAYDVERVFAIDRRDIPGLQGSVAIDLIALLNWRFGDGRIAKHKVRFRLVRETPEGECSPTGQWGVNPVSMRRVQKGRVIE